MPPPQNNENQGLKIAVACFVMLSVILAVTTYFGFKNYGEAYKNFKTAESESTTEKQEREKIQRVLLDFKAKVGLSKTEDSETPKAVDKYREEMQKKVAASVDSCRKAVEEYKNAGGASSKVDELIQSLDTILAGINDTGGSLTAQADRLQELLNNQALISTNLGLEYKMVQNTLEAMNGVNDAKLQVETQALSKVKADLNDEHDKHERDRQTLMAKVDALQTDLNKLAQENTSLRNTIAQKDDENTKRLNELLANYRNTRDLLERKEDVLDRKDGNVTFVDYNRGEVRTDLTRAQGARERMVLTIFDKSASGIPADKPKGVIELIQVGSSGSLGKIVETKNSINPIRSGDIVYSASWDPGRPLQYALIGKIDVNRDGRDDRADLKRLIESSGGRVVYDLPPPGIGPETGKLTPAISWYVVDERDPFHPADGREAKAMGMEDEPYLKKKTAAITTARLDGIRPKSIASLLNELGYSYGRPVPGRVEAADRKSIENLLNPKGRKGVLPTEETPATDEKKDDAKPEGDKPEEEKPDTDKS